MRKVFAYLIKTRQISQNVVQDMVHRKMLYQDNHGNCVFVGYDIKNPDSVIFGCRRGTNTYKNLPGIYQDVITLKDFTLIITEKH